MTLTPIRCNCRRCRRDAIDERLARAWLSRRQCQDIAETLPSDPEAESLARAVADLESELR